jgi:hypothetical protein
MKSLSNLRYAAGVLCLAACLPSTLHAQLLLRDDFATPGNVDTTVWRLPFGSEGTFVGRTQFRGDPAIDIPQQGIVEALAADGRVLEVTLDTFSPIDPGNQFLGTDLLTKRNFARGGGISFESRLRLAPGAPGGIVGGFFMFDVTRENPPGTFVRDEIDWELLSNQTVGSATQDPFTNYWNDGSFADPGDGAFVDIAGFDLTEFHTYRVDWTPQAIRWYVDDMLVRTQTTNVPDDPMQLHLNLWAPNSDFAAAFDAALTPAATAGAGATYTLQVDHVEVNRFNTTVSSNLLTDPSFEEGSLVQITPANGGTLNQWLRFGNVSIEADDIGGSIPGVPDMAPDGIFMAKMFGPFSGGPDATGLLQNVAAAPGEEFEARVWATTVAADSIAGTENFSTIQLSFLNANGQVIESTPFVPVNGHDFPLLDGRDPNLVEETFIEGVVNAVAPEGTVAARVSLFFIQLNNQGGATWFDDVSLVRLTPELPPGTPGDFNGDGFVDAADYTVWRDNLNAADESAFAPGSGNGGGIDATDYTLWRNNFGTMAAGGALAASAAVPEPTTLAMIALACVMAGFARARLSL